MSYETPEVLELGAAEELTLGAPFGPCDDACDCSKRTCPDEELA